LSERKAYEALSSASRLEILKLLQKKPFSVEEIAGFSNLQPITVRHHLQSLEDAGFIESYEEKKRTVGRPKVYYQIAKEPTIITYPKRHYLALSNFMIRTLQSLVGTERTKKFLVKVGKSMGENVIRETGFENDVREWSPEAFREFFIEGYLEESGAGPDIVSSGKDQIVYRLHNCPFFELSVKMPEMMCDTLHEAFDIGVCSAMGGKSKIIRLTCKGHGDPYCEHKCEWYKSSQ